MELLTFRIIPSFMQTLGPIWAFTFSFAKTPDTATPRHLRHSKKEQVVLILFDEKEWNECSTRP
jgi:hypothetical protein